MENERTDVRIWIGRDCKGILPEETIVEVPLDIQTVFSGGSIGLASAGT